MGRFTSSRQKKKESIDSKEKGALPAGGPVGSFPRAAKYGESKSSDLAKAACRKERQVEHR